MTPTGKATSTVAVLGASGLIGEALCTWLLDNEFATLAVARSFTRSQKSRFGSAALERPFVNELGEIERVLLNERIDVVVNCVGVLQDGLGRSTARVHDEFVERLLAALDSRATPALLVHLSVPGNAASDTTPFSLSKRAAERKIAERCQEYIILRPGFVLASAAFGGSALMRALAVQRLALPARDLDRPLAVTDCADIARTIALAVSRWRSGERSWRETWDVMSPEATRVGDVIDALRQRLGAPQPLALMPSWLVAFGAWAGDAAGWLGWQPPIRSTSLRELQRGVAGDPSKWLEATKLVPSALENIAARLPATIQERWFAQLYLLKPLIISVLSFFWIGSAIVATQPLSAQIAVTLLVQHGISLRAAGYALAVGCIADAAVGIAIAFKRTCQIGLIAGLGLSLFYVVGGTAIAPELWSDPLGPLLKIFPELVLTVVALAILDNR